MSRKIKRLFCCAAILAVMLPTAVPAGYAVMVSCDDAGSAVSAGEKVSTTAVASAQGEFLAEQSSVSSETSNQHKNVVLTDKRGEETHLSPDRPSVDIPHYQVTSDYLSYSVGRCVIPGLVDMPLATCDIAYAAGYINSGYATRFCDPYYPTVQTVIGAHYNMGFNGIKSSVPGQTYAYIDGEAFVCAANFRGVNNHRLFDSNGNMINWNGPVMYTCNDSNYHDVTIVYWTKVS